MYTAENMFYAGYVARVFRFNTGEYDYSIAREFNVQLPATNAFDLPNFQAQTTNGYPFQCLGAQDTPICDTSAWTEDLTPLASAAATWNSLDTALHVVNGLLRGLLCPRVIHATRIDRWRSVAIGTYRSPEWSSGLDPASHRG